MHNRRAHLTRFDCAHAGKDQCTTSIPCRTSFIAVLPPDDMSKKKPQIEWLRHFDLICDMNDSQCENLDASLCDFLLDTLPNHGGEIRLSSWLLASCHTRVCFAQEAQCLLKAFYKATRKAMAVRFCTVVSQRKRCLRTALAKAARKAKQIHYLSFLPQHISSKRFEQKKLPC